MRQVPAPAAGATGRPDRGEGAPDGPLPLGHGGAGPLKRALLAEIAARPSDDGPALVYADWAAEQGDTARAELIRLQIEAAGPSDVPARIPTRIRSLLAEHESRWRAELPELPNGVRWGDVERGFVRSLVIERLDLPLSPFLLEAAPIDTIRVHVAPGVAPPREAGVLLELVPRLALARIEEPIQRTGLDDDWLAAVAGWPQLARLQALEVFGLDVGPASVGRLARAPLGKLRRLSWTLSMDRAGPLPLQQATWWAGIQRLALRWVRAATLLDFPALPPTLRELSLPDCDLHADDAEALARCLPPTLTGLDVRRNPILTRGVRALVASLSPEAALRTPSDQRDDEHLALLAQRDAFQRVEALVLGSGSIVSGKGLASVLPRCPGLRHLEAPRALWAADLAWLFRMEDLPLTSLVLPESPIEALPPCRMGALQELRLPRSHLTTADLTAFLEHSHLPSLEVLDLSHNELDDAFVEHLLASPALPALRELLLTGNPIRRDGLAALFREPGLPALRVLHLDPNVAHPSWCMLHLQDAPRWRTLDQLWLHLEPRQASRWEELYEVAEAQGCRLDEGDPLHAQRPLSVARGALTQRSRIRVGHHLDQLRFGPDGARVHWARCARLDRRARNPDDRLRVFVASLPVAIRRDSAFEPASREAASTMLDELVEASAHDPPHQVVGPMDYATLAVWFMRLLDPDTARFWVGDDAVIAADEQLYAVMAMPL